MQISLRGLATSIHGMLFGAFFLLTIFGVLVELCRQFGETRPAEQSARARLLESLYLTATAALGWAAVLSGAYIVFPWYRAVPPAGAINLEPWPQALLRSSRLTAGWHTFGMEWKEHVAWFAPMAMTTVAWIFIRYRTQVRTVPHLRTALLLFTLAAFGSAAAAGLFGAMINKHAPVAGIRTAINIMESTR